MSLEEYKNRRSRRGFIFAGIIVLAGAILLMERIGIRFPTWIVQWEMILIYIGFIIGLVSKFRSRFSWAFTAVGGFFLLDHFDLLPMFLKVHIWPVLIILFGMFVLFLLLFKKYIRKNGKRKPSATKSGKHGKDLDVIDTFSIFVELKKVVRSNFFKGGGTVTILGATEVNFLDADFEESIKLHNLVILGGLKLHIPSSWEVRTNLTSVFGIIGDRRTALIETIPEDKIIILTGTVILGGINIVNS